MTEKALAEKEAYFREMDLLDVSDDESGFPDEGLVRAERSLAESRTMPPPAPPARLTRKSSSVLGPTPRQRQAEFEIQTTRERTISRKLTRSATESEVEVASSLPAAQALPQSTTSPKRSRRQGRPLHSTSLPDLQIVATQAEHEVPFYKRMGDIPRPLGNAKTKKGKPVDINLFLEHQQLLKGRVIYFIPNDDISPLHRQRIHKVIQLGAAWVKTWRSDITHVMVQDDDCTYSQVLKRLKVAALPKDIILVKYEPYVPWCMTYGKLDDPTQRRFLVRNAPQPASSVQESALSPSEASEASLKVKPTREELLARGTQKTESMSVKDSFPPPESAPKDTDGPTVDTVEDSFALTDEEPEPPPEIFGDELAKAIQQTKATAHLPLDEEDSESIRPSNSIEQDTDSGTDDESPHSSPGGKGQSLPKAGTERSNAFNQDNFSCMQPNHGRHSQNPNARTIEILEQMGKYYDQMQDNWRTLAYRKAVTTLRKQTTKISTRDEAMSLPGVGPRLADKIEEIVLTNKLRRLDSTRDDPTDQVLRLFLGIYGVGLSQANKWINSGYRTLEDLTSKAKLTDNQTIGIEHYDEFIARIPRAEVAAHGDYVRKALHKLDAGFEAIVMGSYRRGAKDSGDIDMIITKPRASLSTMRTVVFEELVPQLFEQGFLKASLALSHRHNDGSKFHGASCLPDSSTWRRIDLLLVPEEELGAALIYFTGNDIFNRSMRLLASKKGMRLNQRGLYRDVIRGKNRERITEGTLVEGRSEQKIFEILGVPWREATERIC